MARIIDRFTVGDSDPSNINKSLHARGLDGDDVVSICPCEMGYNVFVRVDDRKKQEPDPTAIELLLLADSVLLTNDAAPARGDLPGQGTVRAKIVDYVMKHETGHGMSA